MLKVSNVRHMVKWAVQNGGLDAEVMVRSKDGEWVKAAAKVEFGQLKPGAPQVLLIDLDE
jgi:hypothetical protein